MRFDVGRNYERSEVKQAAGLAANAKGGNWDTGVVRHRDEFIIFTNVGISATTGHDYDNRWEGDRLHWYHKGGSRIKWPSVQALLDSDAIVHLFWRDARRAPFTYAGTCHALEVFDVTPVEILWEIRDPAAVQNYFRGPDEVYVDQAALRSFAEGRAQTVVVNRYERDPNARLLCIRHYGYGCVVCGLQLEDRYGEIGREYIHVHHLVPLHAVPHRRDVDPIKDLRPLCPNCHAMIHRRQPPFTIEELRRRVRALEG